MNPLASQFNEALGLIELTASKRARAIAAHLQVRTHLETDSQLRVRGVDTVLIGSYRRSTSIRPGKDVDIFVKLPGAGDDPETIYQLVKDALVRRYGERLTENRRSVKIDFGDDGFSVDAVGAEPKDGHWAIPEADPAVFPINGERTAWEDTDPERYTSLTEERNRQPTVEDRGAYVPTVKLLRQVREAHLGDNKPGGLYFEILTYWAFESGITGDSFAEIFANALNWTAGRLATAASDPVLEPALMAPYAPTPSTEDLAQAAAVMQDLAGLAAAALANDDDCAASASWRRILGDNETGPVFPLPEECSEDGTRIAKVESNPAVGPRSERGFAWKR